MTADSSHPPQVVAVIGSPRRNGNTAFAVGLATDALERRGIACETIRVVDLSMSHCRGHDDCETRDACPLRDDAEAAYEKVWAADGVIFASPVHFATVSALMKLFLDRTNHRYLHGPPLTPKAAGLIAIGGQGGMKATLDTLERYLEIVCPDKPQVFTASGKADKLGEAASSPQIRESVLTMADGLATALLGS